MASDINSLIGQLRSFRTRADAVETLIGLGGEAVPALLGALKSRHDGIRSAALICLGQIGDTRACPALLGLLQDDAAGGDAAQALERITGEDFGRDPSAWAEWMRSNGISVPSEYAGGDAGMTTARLVAEALKGADVAIQSKKSGARITVNLPTDRKQVVRVMTGLKDSSGHALLIVYTECGEAAPDKYEWALRNNVRFTQGRLAIQDVKGKPMFVLVNTHLQETLQPEELRISVMKIAAVGDKIEEMLTGKDER